tara:strand:+ start:2162 stop:2926 length:765 start_codon:yes stop_codon:yes gene_type:complete
MIGFINIVKCLIEDYKVDNAFDLEQLILLKREHNMQFSNMGEPPTKFVYYDEDLKEYNMIFMYLREADMIEQYVDSVKDSGQTKFPEEYIVSRYGSMSDLNVAIRPIDIPDTLISKMRATLELGHIRWSDKKRFASIDISTEDKFVKWINTNEIDKIWTTIPEELDGENKAEQFEIWISQKGIALNVEYQVNADNDNVRYSKDQEQISDVVPAGLSLYQDELKQVIDQAKTAKFSDEFFSALTGAGATVDKTQF